MIGEYQLSSGTKLDNAGERVTLVDSVGAVIRDFTYNDKHPWPEAADGDGYSLTLIAPESNPDHGVAGNWRSSVSTGGTPGTSDSVALAGDPDTDGDDDGLTAFLEHALGSSDAVAGMAEVDLFTDPGGDLVFRFRRNLAADDVTYTVQVSTNLLDWVAPGPEFSFESETVVAGGRSEVEWRGTRTGGLRWFVRLHLQSR